MHVQIELITPIITRGIRKVEEVRALERADLTVRHSLIERGPASIESAFDGALAIPDMLRKAIDAQETGAHAIIIDCMGDPGLHACREVVQIPVLGPCQTALHTASMLGHRVGFVTVLERVRTHFNSLVASYGLASTFASFRAIDVPVLEIHADSSRVKEALARESVAAIKEDHADVIVLGCTGFLGCADSIRQTLLASGLDVPVIDPIPLAVHVADALVRTRLSHSKRTYPEPGRKPIEGYPFPEFATAPVR
jgi:allantoin racemase